MQWVKSGDLYQNYEVFEKIGTDGKIHRNFVNRAKSSKGQGISSNVVLNTLSHTEIPENEKLQQRTF
mgnify:FL=1